MKTNFTLVQELEKKLNAAQGAMFQIVLLNSRIQNGKSDTDDLEFTIGNVCDEFVRLFGEPVFDEDGEN